MRTLTTFWFGVQMPPGAHAAAVTRQFALHQIGNASWEIVFGEVLPEVCVLPTSDVCLLVERCCACHSQPCTSCKP